MGFNFNIIKQAKELAAKMEKLKEEISQKTVEASSGGGMVTVVANCANQIVSIKIEKEVVNPEDVEMLQDLILAAVNEALRRAQDLFAEEMAKITGGIKIPGLT